MKQLLVLTLFLAGNLIAFAQQTMDVTLKITYRNNPMCYWDVTIKHGDMELAKGKTDDKGVVKFKYVRLMSRSIDVYGYKKTANGDKKWDIKGYITLNDQGSADFDFETLLQETGMPQGMMEAAWGLTLNDCSSGGGSSGGMSSGSSSGSSSSSSSGSSGSSSNSEMKEDFDKWDKEQEEKKAKQKAEQDQFMEDFQSGKSAAESLQQQKTSLEGKVEGLNGKISRRQGELAKMTPGSKEHNDLSYEIRDLELERDLASLKLEKVNKEIAAGNTMLPKELRQDFKEREEVIKTEQDQLKADQKAGKRFGGKSEVTPVSNGTATNGSATTENGESQEKGSSSGKADEDEGENDDFVLYSDAEIANMSTVGLQKAKMSYNTKITNRKMSLKTKAAIMKQDKKQRLESEIEQLTKAVEKMEAELAKRKAE